MSPSGNSFLRRSIIVAYLFNKTTRVVEDLLRGEYSMRISAAIDNSTRPYTLRIFGVRKDVFSEIETFLSKFMRIDQYLLKLICPVTRRINPKPKGKRARKNNRVGLTNVVEKRPSKPEKSAWIPNMIIYEYQTRMGYKNRFYSAWQKG